MMYVLETARDEGWDLTIRSASPGGTTVRVMLPARQRRRRYHDEPDPEQEPARGREHSADRDRAAASLARGVRGDDARATR